MSRGSGSGRARAVAAGWLLAAGVVVSGCGGPAEAIDLPRRNAAIENYIERLEEMAEILGDIVDSEDALRAAPRIRQHARRMVDLRGRIGRIQGTYRDHVVSRYGDRLGAASERLRRETGRLGEQPDIVASLREALAAVPPLS